MLVRDPVKVTTLPLLVSGLLLGGASARMPPRKGFVVNKRRRPRAVRGAGLPVRGRRLANLPWHPALRGLLGASAEKSRRHLRSAHEQRPGEVCLRGCCPGGRELGAAVHSMVNGGECHFTEKVRDAGELSLGPTPRRFSVARRLSLAPPPPPPPPPTPTPHPCTRHTTPILGVCQESAPRPFSPRIPGSPRALTLMLTVPNAPLPTPLHPRARARAPPASHATLVSDRRQPDQAPSV